MKEFTVRLSGLNLGNIKHLMTDTRGNSEFCSPGTYGRGHGLESISGVKFFQALITAKVVYITDQSCLHIFLCSSNVESIICSLALK